MSAQSDPNHPLDYRAGGSGPRGRGGQKLPIFACIVALSIFASSLKMLYSSWIGRENPNGMIVIQGDPSTADAAITITSADRPGKLSLSAKITEGVEHRLRFHLPPGRYNIDITEGGVHHPARSAVDVKTSEATFITLTPVATSTLAPAATTKP